MYLMLSFMLFSKSFELAMKPIGGAQHFRVIFLNKTIRNELEGPRDSSYVPHVCHFGQIGSSSYKILHFFRSIKATSNQTFFWKIVIR